MRHYPESVLILTGCNSAIDEEKGNLNLSYQRAVNLKKYLTDIWVIDSNRIKIETKNLPDNPSRSLTDEGIAENRRVELSSSDIRLLMAVTTSENLRVATPEIINFKSFVSVKGGAATWDLIATQDSKILKSFSGEGSLNKDLEWNINDEKQAMPVNESPVKFELLVKDKSRDKIIVAKGELPVRQLTTKLKSTVITGDKRIDKYSLILFDFAKSNLNEGNMDIISLIKENIKPESKVIIYGYSDIIGNDVYNLKLSEKRASETGKALGIENAVIRAMGNSKLLYDNTFPEGRFYCRTVEIVIETPVKNNGK
jgi:outer membrane protein OmpA-like peptidoglycan-associated protein